MPAENYWTRLAARRWSRRAALRASAKAAIGVSGLALVGCGDDDDDAAPAPAAEDQADQQAAGATQQEQPADEADTEEQAAPQETAQATPGRGEGGSLSDRLISDPPTIDPHQSLAFSTQQPALFTYSRLLKWQSGAGRVPSDFQYEGDLASSVEQPDAGTTVLTLRDGVVWQNVEPLNGRPLTAEDVDFSWQRFREISPGRNTMDFVDRMEVVDAGTVRFINREPNVTIITRLASSTSPMLIVPREVVEEDGDLSQRMVGSGPWILDSFEPSVAFRWRANPDYYIDGLPRATEFRRVIIPDTATAEANIRSGQLAIMGGVPSGDMASLTDAVPDLQVVSWLPIFQLWVWNPSHLDPFRDPRARQAMSNAIDRDALVEAMHGGEGSANNVIPRGHVRWSYDPRTEAAGPAAQYFQHDPQAAQQLMDAAGIEEYSTTLGLNADFGAAQQLYAETVASMLRDARLDITIDGVSSPEYLNGAFIGKYDGLFMGNETPFEEPTDFYTLSFLPESPRHHHNELGAEDLFERMRNAVTIVDADARVEEVLSIEREINEQMYFVPLGIGNAFAVAQPWVRDWWWNDGYGQGAENLVSAWNANA